VLSFARTRYDGDVRLFALERDRALWLVPDGAFGEVTLEPSHIFWPKLGLKLRLHFGKHLRVQFLEDRIGLQEWIHARER